MSDIDVPAGQAGGPNSVPASAELPEKLRVHALAKRLSVTSRKVLDTLAALGAPARGAQSSIDRESATRVADTLGLAIAADDAEDADLVGEPPNGAVEPSLSGDAVDQSPSGDAGSGEAGSASTEAPAAPVAGPGDEAEAEEDVAPGAPLPLFAAPSPMFLPPAPVATRTPRTRTRSKAEARPEPEHIPDEDVAPELTEDEEVTDTNDVDGADGADGVDDGADSRRRRRRGRRGRGRGRGGDEDGPAGEGEDGSPSDGAQPDRSRSDDDESDSGADDSRDDRGEDSGEDSSADGDEDRGDSDDGTDSESGSGSRRRRRRRRRKGSADDQSDSDDDSDPPNTVVRIREPRTRSDSGDDGIQGVRGSTRLEAKRQRRRDGRDAGRRRTPVLSESEFLARRESVERTMVVRQHGERSEIGVLEDGVLVEHFVTSSGGSSLVGNVYLGRVQNVLPSMEAAFVDIGRGRNAVLYAGEVDWDAAGLAGKARKIEQALSSGDSVLVQVTKDPVGHKGARLTTQISLPGRFLVYVPAGGTHGISRKLADTERRRLKDLLREIVPDDAGVIIRTASEGVSQEALERDVRRLQAQWEVVSAKAEAAKSGKSKAPELLYEEPDLMIKVVRDQFNEDFSKLVVSGDDAWDTLDAYVRHVAPELQERLYRHVGTSDVFSEYRIDEQLTKALDRKVWLPSGGTLVIDRTEAMTVVDVNTGKFTGSGGNLEETVTRNNLEAAEEIVRQLRLRDIGGIIVVDFIDMVLESNRDLVLRRLTECLGRDRTRHQVAEVTSLGLVQMTRKRVGVGLLEAFSTPCEHCRGRGVVVSTDPVEPKADSGPGISRRRGGRPDESGRRDEAARRDDGGRRGDDSGRRRGGNGGGSNGGGSGSAPSGGSNGGNGAGHGESNGREAAATPNGRSVTGEVQRRPAEPAAPSEPPTPAALASPSGPSTGAAAATEDARATEDALATDAARATGEAAQATGEVAERAQLAKASPSASSTEDPPTEQLAPTKRTVVADAPAGSPAQAAPAAQPSGEVRRVAPTGVTGAVTMRAQAPAEQDPDTVGQVTEEAADEPASPVMAGASGVSAGRPARRRRRVASRPAGPPAGEDPV
ncbi:MAG TPA: translation initiation factor IF-2 N-terminal domain-containing protein [Pseudonocardia sp.]|nr:translation initiation factor IF-2 N-terminal domain-containing protein [Pseudonocardia sp.]